MTDPTPSLRERVEDIINAAYIDGKLVAEPEYDDGDGSDYTDAILELIQQEKEATRNEIQSGITERLRKEKKNEVKALLERLRMPGYKVGNDMLCEGCREYKCHELFNGKLDDELRRLG